MLLFTHRKATYLRYSSSEKRFNLPIVPSLLRCSSDPENGKFHQLSHYTRQGSTTSCICDKKGAGTVIKSNKRITGKIRRDKRACVRCARTLGHTMRVRACVRVCVGCALVVCGRGCWNKLKSVFKILLKIQSHF